MKKRITFTLIVSFTAIVSVLFFGCKKDETQTSTKKLSWLEEETYAGGKLGTTFNRSSSAYEDPAPAVTDVAAFKYGEYLFERDFTQNTPPFNGLGPLYIRSSCIACHPGYGHGKRMDRYAASDWGNGYLLVVTDQNDTYISSLTGMPQTKAVPPFKAPIDESQIQITWLNYTDEWGNTFPDGESYSLIYPEVYIPASAYYVPLEVGGTTIPYGSEIVRLESTIGIYGTGLLDAIPDDSLKAQYQKEYNAGANLNPAMWAGSDWAPTGLYGNTGHPKRFTYACTRGPLQDGPGANAIWNITNVTRKDRRYHYMTTTYARTASQDPNVQAEFYNYFPEYNITGNPETDIYNYLTSNSLPAEMSDDDYANLMVWHRGLAVPAARDLSDPTIQRGRELFREIGCTYCHRPSWTTGPDRFTDPNHFFTTADQRLPRYPNQKIWPYSDMIQHKLYMKNDIRTGWCRTTPLWGRGLSAICTGSADRMHDCRARNVIEAIMWHGNSQSDARRSVEKFRMLSKEERNAIVKFINAI